MTTLTSKHDAPLPLPNGITLKPGATVAVENWPVLRLDDMVKSWLAAGIVEATIDPLDHDEDGQKGGSVAAGEDGLDELRTTLEELGVKPDKRWGEERLQAEIAAARAR